MELFIEIKTEIKNFMTMLCGKLDHLDEKFNVFVTFLIPCVN
jgi:hypothetical protein